MQQWLHCTIATIMVYDTVSGQCRQSERLVFYAETPKRSIPTYWENNGMIQFAVFQTKIPFANIQCRKSFT